MMKLPPPSVLAGDWGVVHLILWLLKVLHFSIRIYKSLEV